MVLKMHNFKQKSSLKKNVVFNIIYQLVQIGVPILLIPILSGRLKTNGNGNYAFLHSIVQYFSYFALLGVNYFGTKAIANARANGDEEKNKTFWTIFYAKILTSTIAIVGYLIFSFIYWQDHFVLFTQLFFLLANLLDVTWFFSGDENFKSLCIRNVSIKTVSFVLIVLFVQNQSDVGIYSLILGLSEVANQVFMWGLLIKKRIFKKEFRCGIKFKQIVSSLKGMAIFFIPQFLIELYTILNVTILGIVWGSSSMGEVGIFDYANKIVSVLTAITVSLGIVFLARLSYLNSENKIDEIKEKISKSLYYALFISIPLVCGVISTGHSFVNWFLDGEEWAKVGVLLYFLPLKVLFVAVSNTLGVQYLLSTNKIKKYIISVACGAAVCIVLNLILVKSLGSIGSAISVVSAEFVVTLVQCLFVRKEIDLRKTFLQLWKVGLSAVAMAIIVFVFYIFFYNNICKFYSNLFGAKKLAQAFADITIMISGALVYFATLCITKEKTFVLVLKRIEGNISPRPTSLILYSLVGAITLSFGFYKPYYLTFKSNLNIKRRSAATTISMSDNRIVEVNEDYGERDFPFCSVSLDKYNFIVGEVNDQRNTGFIYHYNHDLNGVDAVSYKFRFFQCQDYGTTFKIKLCLAIYENNYILSNIDKLYINVDVRGVKDAEAPNVNINLNNENDVLKNYFNNKNRDFVAYNDSTTLWTDDDFKSEKADGKIYKDDYFCTITFCIINETDMIVVDKLGDFDFREEVWLLNG